MKHISILVPQGNSVVDTIIAPYNLFKMANSYHQKMNGLLKPIFTIDLVSTDGEPVKTFHHYAYSKHCQP